MKLSQLKNGYVVVKASSKDDYRYVMPSDTNALGVAWNGALVAAGIVQVYVYGTVQYNQPVRSRAQGDGGLPGMVVGLTTGYSTAYLQVGTALESGRDKLISVALNIRYMTAASLSGILGSGTANRITKFTGATTIGNSGLVDDGTNISTSENIRLQSDSRKYYAGAGNDMTMWYDGVSGNLKTSDVAASDLDVDCGTDKTIRLVETVWDDSMVAPTAFRSGSTSLTFDALTSTIYTHRFDVGDEIHVAIQFPHTIKVGTAVVPHLHLINKNAIGATGYNVAFNFYYTWASIGQVFPSELSQLDVRQSFQNASALTHKMLNFTAITPTAAQGGISSIFLARLVRVAAGAEPYNTADIFTLGFDIHFEVDTMGSRQIGTK